MPVLGAGPDIMLFVITPRLISFWSAERLVVALKQRGGEERLCVIVKTSHRLDLLYYLTG